MCRTIAIDAMDRTPPIYEPKIFESLDRIADQDPIYCAGIESAQLFKKKMQQCFHSTAFFTVSMSTSGTNLYMTLSNNDVDWNVFFVECRCWKDAYKDNWHS
jgi:hypothetical protein